MNQTIRYVGVCVFALLLVSCGVLTAIYESAQTSLVLEGNNLYTDHAVIVEGNFDEVSQKLSSADISFLSYREIEGDPFTRALYSSDHEMPRVPLHKRSSPPQSESRYAWVGSRVATERSETGAHIRVNGTQYPVAAILGVHPNSILAEHIVVYDHSLFQNYEGSFVVDGPEITSHALSLLNIRFTDVPEGTSHRTNVDLITPVILTLNVLLTGFGGAAYGAYCALSLVPRNTALRIVGHQQSHIFGRTLTEILLPLAVASAAALTVASAAALTVASATVPQFNAALMGVTLTILCVCAATGLIVVWCAHAKRITP